MDQAVRSLRDAWPGERGELGIGHPWAPAAHLRLPAAAPAWRIFHRLLLGAPVVAAEIAHLPARPTSKTLMPAVERVPPMSKFQRSTRADRAEARAHLGLLRWFGVVGDLSSGRLRHRLCRCIATSASIVEVGRQG